MQDYSSQVYLELCRHQPLFDISSYLTELSEVEEAATCDVVRVLLRGQLGTEIDAEVTHH
jgi:hypothetical protein